MQRFFIVRHPKCFGKIGQIIPIFGDFCPIFGFFYIEAVGSEFLDRLVLFLPDDEKQQRQQGDGSTDAVADGPWHQGA